MYIHKTNYWKHYEKVYKIVYLYQPRLPALYFSFLEKVHITNILWNFPEIFYAHISTYIPLLKARGNLLHKCSYLTLFTLRIYLEYWFIAHRLTLFSQWYYISSYDLYLFFKFYFICPYFSITF